MNTPYYVNYGIWVKEKKLSTEKSSQTFNILAIDGGGIRGIVPAHILNSIVGKLGIDLNENFQMLAGTSTGSIIVAGLACGISTEEIANLYKSIGEKIFIKNESYWPKNIKPAFHSLYDNTNLKKTLKETFGDIKLGDIKKPLLIPSTDIGNGGVHVFKSNYCKHFTRDMDVPVCDAVLASCSAPTFFDPTIVGEYALADGGLWANNPSLAAFIDAQRRLSIPADSIKILSVGTGHAKSFYGTDLEKKWGMLNGWQRQEFISFILSLQSQSTHNYLQLIMKEDHLLRLNFESDLPLPLDDCTATKDLFSRADKLFTYETENIKAFFNY